MNKRMDLAHVIKGLLSVECIFRLIACLFTNSLRGAFLLWGWQPTFLIHIASILENVTGQYRVGQKDWIALIYEANDTCFNEENVSHTILFSNLTCDVKQSNRSDTNFQDFGFIDPRIESVCFLPSSLAMFNSFGIAIFVLLTGILRCVRNETVS